MGVELNSGPQSRLEMRRHLAGTSPIGVSRAASAQAPNRSSAFARTPEQAVLGGGVRLDRSVDQNMPERKSALRQGASHQQAAMAVERLSLTSAHDTQAIAPHRFTEATEAGAKCRSRRHPLVVGDLAAIKHGIAQPAQRIAERQIGDVRALQARSELSAGEPRKTAREGNRAHIRERGDAGVPPGLFMNASAARLEWPMVMRSKSAWTVIAV